VLRRLRRSESGAELIEFALTLPLLLLVVLGIIEFGFVFQQYEVVTNAAREGARIAALNTYGPTPATRVTNAKDRVRQYLIAGGLDANAATICVGPDGGCDGAVTPSPITGGAGTPTCVLTIQVKVEYAHPILFVGPIVRHFNGSLGNMTLRARSTMRTEAGAAGACPPAP
jgi:Flp pilus assembly protein TadG